MKKIILPFIILSFITSAYSAPAKTPKGKAKMGKAHGTPRSDSDIINMLMTINTEEMNLSKLAKNQAQDPKVKEFANKMLTAHAENNDKAAKLRREQKIKLTETKSSKSLKTTSASVIENLRKIEGKKFDKAYMQEQITVHKKALDKLESTLIPHAKDTKLKTMLEETKKHVESHLKEAQELQIKTL